MQGLENFNNAGFAIVPEILGDAEIASLLAAMEATGEGEYSRQRDGERYAIRNLLASVPAVKKIAESGPVQALVKGILGNGAFAVRGLWFDKTPGANWKVPWHQDLTIAVQQRREIPGYGPWSVKAGIQHVQPPATVLEEMLTIRLHFDDCAQDNGPLQVLPGSHRSGKLSAGEIQKWRGLAPPVSCVAKRGSALLMRPLLLHASSAARNPRHRRVVHLEFAARPLDGGLEWRRD